MTLIRTDGDGLKVVSDIGKVYFLYELVTIGTPEKKSNDIVVIMERSGLEEEGLVSYFYGADLSKMDKIPFNFIRNAISEYESEKYDNNPLIEGDIIQTF